MTKWTAADIPDQTGRTRANPTTIGAYDPNGI